MIIICPSCGKNFDVDENLIPDKGRLLKCGSCNQTWFFNKNKDEEIKPLTDEVVVEEKPKVKEKKIDCEVIEPKKRKIVKKSYTDNFLN